jgi:hypothetical protein
MAAPNIVLQGVTTLSWGTANRIAVTGWLCEVIDMSPTFSGPVASAKNGDGARVGIGLMDDGFKVSLKGKYDTNTAFPALGNTVVLTTKTNTNYNLIVVTNPLAGISFKEGDYNTISFTCEYIPGVLA